MLKKRLKKDLTQGPIFVGLLTFVIPIVLTGILQVMYSMADNIVVGQFSGDEYALGAVGCTAALTTFFINLFLGISAGAGVVIAQFYGAKQYGDVSRAAHTAMAFSVIFGIGVMLFGFATVYPMLKLMGTPSEYMDNSVLYAMIICAGFPASSIYNFGAATLRSVGDSKTPLMILATTGIVNVVFNLVFVIGFGMSVAGVAIATIIAQYLSAVWVVLVLIKRRDQSYGIEIKRLKIEKCILTRILRIGVPIAVQSSLFSISNLVVTSAVNTFPPATIDAKPIAFNIEGLTYTAMNGFATAAMTFIGQNYGARKNRRINRIFLYSVLQVAVVGILIAQIEIFFGREISLLYVDADNPNREEIVKAVLEIFEIMLTTYFLCGIMEVLSGILKGLGYATISVIASLIGLAVRVAWLLFVTPTEKFHTIFGLFVSYTISWTLTILLLLACCAYVWRKLGIWRGAKQEKLEQKENEI